MTPTAIPDLAPLLPSLPAMRRGCLADTLEKGLYLSVAALLLFAYGAFLGA